jgi:hypothetical protein
MRVSARSIGRGNKLRMGRPHDRGMGIIFHGLRFPDLSSCTIDGVDAGDSFECYDIGYTGPFPGGNGWDGPWVVSGEIDYCKDTFETYVLGTTGNWTAGTGWEGGWVVGPPALDLIHDTFESYSVGATPSSGGSGWDGNWNVIEGP